MLDKKHTLHNNITNKTIQNTKLYVEEDRHWMDSI